MSADAIARYHDLLASGTLADDSHSELSRLLKHRGLFFGQRPVCSVLRPRFLPSEQYRELRSEAAVLSHAFRMAHDRALHDPAVLEQFQLRDWEADLIRTRSGYECPTPIARFDGFFTPSGHLRFVEINTQSPAGAGYVDTLADVFSTLPVMHEFTKRYHLTPLPSTPGIVRALLSCYKQWNRTTDPPRIAIVDWCDEPTYGEFMLFAERFRSLGFETRIIDPRDLEYDGTNLCGGDFRINLVYKRVLLHQLVERCGLNHPLIRAAADGAVCMVNPFACRLLGKKTCFAILSDERNRHLFSAEQLQAIADHIPWTRTVEDRKTTYGHEPIDLIPFIMANRERLVLKPIEAHGGKNVVLGWTVGSGEWNTAVERAIGNRYVVQAQIDLPVEAYPSYESGTLEIVNRWIDTAPFVGPDHVVHGCLTRLSRETIVNVSAGGGATVPTFLIEDR